MPAGLHQPWILIACPLGCPYILLALTHPAWQLGAFGLSSEDTNPSVQHFTAGTGNDAFEAGTH